MLTLHFSPLLPVPVLLGLGSIGALLWAFSLWRRARGALLRAACFALALLFLAGPRLEQRTMRPVPDIAVLILDETPSMAVGDRLVLERAARAALTHDAARLPDLEWRVVSVPKADPRTGESGTQLFTALNRALTGIPAGRLAGFIAITDGQAHDKLAGPLPAPLHVLLTAAGEQTDRRIRVMEAPSFGLVGQSVLLKIAVDDLGPVPTPAPASALLTIRHDGAPPRVVRVGIGKTLTLSLPVTRVGPTILDLSADPLPGEVSTLNNHATLVVNGVRDRLKVLLLSGLPHPGEPVWRRMLKADPAVNLAHITILRLPHGQDRTPISEMSLSAFHSRDLFEEKIRDFDLVILDRFPHRGLLPDTYLRDIAAYVLNGGALLLSVGPEFASSGSLAYSPLADILPAAPASLGGVVVEAFRPRLSPLGQRHPVTDDLPDANHWGPWYRRIQATQTRGEAVLAAQDGSPLLILDHAGQGRVALLLSDQVWLWARGHDGGGPAAALLRRIAHWLMKQPELEEESLTAHFDGDHLLIDRRSLSDAPPPPVAVTSPDGQTRRIPLIPAAPGRARADLAAAQPGLWSVSDGTHTAYAAASPEDPLEIADLRVTATVLEKIAAQSGGGVHWLKPDGVPTLRRVDGDQPASGAQWIGLRRHHAQNVTGVTTAPLLPAWLACLLDAALLLAAWWREGGQNRVALKDPAKKSDTKR